MKMDDVEADDEEESVDGIRCPSCGWRNVYYSFSLDVFWNGQTPEPIEWPLANDGTDIVSRRLRHHIGCLYPTQRLKYSWLIHCPDVIWSTGFNKVVACPQCHSICATPHLKIQFSSGDDLVVFARKCGKCKRDRLTVTDNNLAEVFCPACHSQGLERLQVIY